MWHFTHVLRYFHFCSCIVHLCSSLLHVKCLTKCPSDIFVLNWIQVNSNFWVYTCLTLFHLFWSLCMCFTHFSHVAHIKHTLKPSRHTSCISCCIPMHHMLHTHASAHAQHRHTHAQLLHSCTVFMHLCFKLLLLYV